MKLCNIHSESKSLEQIAFEIYLRTGLRLTAGALRSSVEEKFNPNHDPANGRFTFKPGGGSLPPRVASTRMGQGPASPRAARPGTIKLPAPKGRAVSPNANRAPPLGQLSSKYESGGDGDPGTVSSGMNDPGGVSYGKHQYAAKAGTAARFVQSPEAARWTNEFRGLIPGSPQFSAKWRQIAVRDRMAFGNAQDSFTGRTYYDHAIRGVLRATGLNLDAGGRALRETTFSVAVQHGGAVSILRDAISITDKQIKRTDSSYRVLLINAIYDRRVRYVTRLREAARQKRKFDEARTFDNILKNRYPDERRDALRILHEGN